MNDKKTTRTISITSGKGGVGKTSLLSNLALDLSNKGSKVLLLDGDFGMANLDIMFNVRATKNIEDVIKGRATMEDILVPVKENVFLIPGGSGVYGMNQMDCLQRQSLLDQVSQLDQKFDYMLIDTAPGIDDNVLYLNAAAEEILVVLTPDPSSLADAYALIKVLHQRQHETHFSIVCNLVRDEQEALAIYKRLSDVAAKFLCVSLDYKGFIPMDTEMRRATKAQQLVLNANPRSLSSLAIRRLSENLSRLAEVRELKGGLQFFWQQLSGVA